MDHKKTGEYWNGNADNWTKLVRMGYDKCRVHLSLPAFLHMLPNVKELTGLDIGCGEGSNTRVIQKRGAKMTAIDISEKFIQHAKNLEKQEQLGIHYQVASAIEIPFDDNAFDFILKPVDQEKFGKVFRKAIKKIQMDENKTYAVEARDKLLVFKLNQIVYFESSKKKVIVHCEDNDYTGNEGISSVETKLSNQGFLRISRFYLVNMQHIKTFKVKEIFMSNGASLTYSKKKCNELKQTYMEFVMEDM